MEEYTAKLVICEFDKLDEVEKFSRIQGFIIAMICSLSDEGKVKICRKPTDNKLYALLLTKKKGGCSLREVRELGRELGEILRRGNKNA